MAARRFPAVPAAPYAARVAGALVSVEWLRGRLGEPGLVLVDCRYRLGEPGAGARLWRESHIQGAAFLDVDRDLAAPPGGRGQHPLPERAAFEAAARRAGIASTSRVVAYDEAAEGGAARLWWLLRHFGHGDVSVLDGGLRAWRRAGGPMRGGEEELSPGSFTASEPTRGDDTASAEELGAPHPPLMLDARAPERYRGEIEPIDSVAGHIPGARNLPFAELAPGGRFLAPAELRARFEAAGAGSGTGFVAYCGSGVTACVLLLAAEVAGLRGARLYPGSWSEWSRRGLPAEPPARH